MVSIIDDRWRRHIPIDTTKCDARAVALGTVPQQRSQFAHLFHGLNAPIRLQAGKPKTPTKRAHSLMISVNVTRAGGDDGWFWLNAMGA